MFLKRLEISGFKSFAGKTVLQLEPGVTAIVGPNGSGKSNLSDAIKWALGEQGKGSLRLKKSDELIFAGTDKRPRASLAEVGLLLDNSEGTMAIDFSEVELSRLLYRSGESEYRLNRRKIRMVEAQQLLVASGFGPNSYAVIAQGTIDTFILATPAERKLLFEEASGIRHYEIKREQAIRKLEATESNLSRVRDVLAELEPRLRDLGRSAAAAQEREAQQGELERLRAVLISTAETVLPDQIQSHASILDQQTDQIKFYQKQVNALAKRQTDLSHSQAEASKQRQAHSEQLQTLEINRDQLSGELSVKRAELQYLSERQGIGLDLSQQLEDLEAQEKLIHKQIAASTASLRTAQSRETDGRVTLKASAAEVSTAQTRLNQLRRQLDETSRQQYVSHALGILKHLARGLADGSLKADELKLMIHKAGRLLGHATAGQTELLAGLKQMQLKLTAFMKQRDTAQEACNQITLEVRSLELDLSHLDKQLDQLSKRKAETKAALADLPTLDSNLMIARRKELKKIEHKLGSVTQDLARLRDQHTILSDSVDPDTVFALASETEATKTKLAEAQQEHGQTLDSIALIKQQLAGYRAKSKQWFPHGSSPVPASNQNLADIERQIELIELKISSYVEADREVLEEHAEVAKRHEFLSSQLSDLESAKQDLANIIRQLEDLIGSKFKTAFAGISGQFSYYFEKLFQGGRAELTLKPDSGGTYGIEIIAVPPGKRVQSLATLSGGERSLTGIALLAAILNINPSPFVVLDEVDAALDEANSARLATILTEIAKKTQLIVITHNRTTMQAAHSLFGVTMDEQQVSRVLSLRLQEAWDLVPSD